MAHRPYKHPVYEVNDEVSLTIPDESLTIQEIVYRYRSGEPLEVRTNNVQYDDDSEEDDFIHPSNRFGLDLTDLEDLKNQIIKDEDK